MTSTSEPAAASTSSYDRVPYPAISHPQTHPNHLAAMARLFGLSAADPMQARVLELGCADGSNLLPMAEQAPGATFLGIDASQVQIDAGLKAIKSAGLKNVELRQQDLLAFPASAGKFDYIIAHAVYSWVSQPVREKLMAICRDHLAENGVAIISYNTRPGWNMRQSLRDLMLFHSRNLEDPKTKVGQARAIAAFVAEALPAENNPYGQYLKSELNALGSQPDNLLLHDILGAENTPVYFSDFINEAVAHGLQYVSEPSLVEMLATNFPDKVRDTLEKLNNRIVAQEQYMDFIRNRFFRQTILCRSNVALQRTLSPSALTLFAFRSLLRNPETPVDFAPGVAAKFTSVNGFQISSADPFVKAVLTVLAESGGVSALSYAALLDSARARSRKSPGNRDQLMQRNQIDESTLQNNLLNLLVKGLIEIYVHPMVVSTEVPGKPAMTALMRYQAMNSPQITNRIHMSFPADPVPRYVMAACDGTRTRDEILGEVVERVREGKLQVSEGAAKMTDPKKIRTALAATVGTALGGLAKGGFFAPQG